SFPFEVTGVSAALKTVPEAKAGETIEIEWEGPDNQGDMITIVPETEREGKYGAYKYTKNKMGPRKLPVVELNAPDEPGTYEVRYVTGKDRFTLAAVKLQVGQTNASVKAPETVVEGSKFAVDWEGPDNQGDMITIVTPQTKEGTYGEYQYTKQKAGPRKLNQVQLTAPEELGTYEVRYVTGGKKFTLSSQTIQVVAASATVEGPEEAVTREVFDVTWEGPGNQGDYIAIVKPDAAEGEVKERAYVHRGKALRLKAPEMEGAYELQYITGKMGKVLAQTSIQIVPSKVPGELKVVADGSNVLKTIGGDTNVSLILDASGSMLKKEQGERRIDVAKKAVTKLLNGPLVDGTPFSLRVFGHKEADSCRTDLEIPLGPLNRSSAEKLVSNLEAKNYAKTPIAKSLELIQKDFEGSEGRRVIILLTDGEETCGGDPAEAIKELAKSGFETRVNIIGFAIDEQMLKDTFQEWARLGNGKYFDAANAQELERSILEAVEVPYEVLDDKQQLIASGVVNGDPISVLPGKYTVKVLSSPEKSFENVRIEPEMTEELRVAG
ncbi:MAG: VWA domain-containing protein, partial [Bdellovibrionales bacterium]|nr:VWA domain-containing protein [Bdellovibrionales bacterium]